MLAWVLVAVYVGASPGAIDTDIFPVPFTSEEECQKLIPVAQEHQREQYKGRIIADGFACVPVELKPYGKEI